MSVQIKIDADLRNFDKKLSLANKKLQNLDISKGNLGGIKKMNTQLATSNKSLGRLDKTVTQLKRSFVTLGVSIAGALGANSAIRAGDEIRNLTNLLKASGVEAGKLNSQLAFVANTANNTRVSFGAAGTLLARMTRSTKSLGASAKEVQTATTAILQGFQVSGASAEEAKNAVIQLSQGLASGQLRGEELNSVLEGGTRIAESIAKELGVGVGQLRQLAADGKITSEVVMKALINDAKNLQGEFDLLEPTFAQAFQVFKNGAGLAAGQTSNILLNTLGINEALINAGKAMTESFTDGSLAIAIESILTSIRIAFINIKNIGEFAGNVFEQKLPEMPQASSEWRDLIFFEEINMYCCSKTLKYN